MPASEIQLARRTQENLLFSIAKYCQVFIGKFPSVRFTVQSNGHGHACGLHDFRWLLLNEYLAVFQKQTGHCDWKTEAGKQLPGRFKLTGAWCEELLSQMKHIFLFCFPKELELLRTQIQLQAAEISKLQTENQKLQAMVPVTYHLISSLGTKHSC